MKDEGFKPACLLKGLHLFADIFLCTSCSVTGKLFFLFLFPYTLTFTTWGKRSQYTFCRLAFEYATKYVEIT